MTEERRKAVWPWVVATLIAMTVLYVASFGIACRRVAIPSGTSFGSTAPANDHFPLWFRIYSPIGRLASSSETANQAIEKFARVFVPPGHALYLPRDSSTSIVYFEELPASWR